MRTTESQLSSITRIPLKDLRSVPAKWNLRDFAADAHREYIERENARELVDRLCGTLERVGKLDPLIVFEVEGVFEVVDGHYRYEAYSRVRPDNTEIPVRIFLGSQEEARRHAYQENIKVRAVMSTAQRTEAAWQLYATDRTLQAMSQRKLAKFLDVSQGTVFNMKTVLASIDDIEQIKRSAYKVEPWREAFKRLRDDEDEKPQQEDSQLVQQIALGLEELLSRNAKTHPREVRLAWETIGRKYGLPHSESKQLDALEGIIDDPLGEDLLHEDI